MAVAVAPDDATGSAEMNRSCAGRSSSRRTCRPRRAGRSFRGQRDRRERRRRLRRKRGGAMSVAEPSEHLEIVKSPREPAADYRRDARSAWRSPSVLEREVRLCEHSFSAPRPSGKESKLRSTLSVRPPSPFMTRCAAAISRRTSVELPIDAQHVIRSSASSTRPSPRSRSVSPMGSMFT